MIATKSNNNHRPTGLVGASASGGLLPLLGTGFLVLACLATRIAFMGNYLEGWDDVDFALALHDYDISRYQPHFPGYPVYISVCWFVSKIFGNDVLALTLPGAVFGALTAVPLYLLAKGLFSTRVAFIAALLFAVNPLCWLQSERPTSDAMGMFFVVLSAHLLFASIRSQKHSRTYFIAGGIVFAVTLGIRLAYFPFIAIWIYALYNKYRRNGNLATICCGIASLAFGLSFWLIPLICHVKFTNLLGNALAFTHGHFTDWGGSVGTSPHVGQRLVAFSWCLFGNGLGFWWFDTPPIHLIPSVIMIVGLLSTCRGTLQRAPTINEKTRFILLYIIPYTVWVVFCQNLEKPRHVLPLVPILLICLAYILAKMRLNGVFKITFIGLLVVSIGASSFRLVSRHKRNPPLQVQVMNYIVDNFDKKSTRLYCWETKRLFDYYAPDWSVRRAKDIDDLKYDINASLVTPETVLCTSQIEGIEQDIEGMTPLKRFRTDRYIDNPCSELSLYQIRVADYGLQTQVVNPPLFGWAESPPLVGRNVLGLLRKVSWTKN